jgi:class 3 adenylate cyclase
MAATLDERTDDIRAVMDAANSEKAVIFGASEGASMACLFAATYPERTQSLMIWGAQARWTQTDDYPWGLTREEHERMLQDLREGWPSKEYLTGPGAGLGNAVDPAYLDWFVRYAQAGASPAAALALEEMNADVDVREILPSIRVPTLVMNRTGDPIASVDAARDMAHRIPGAQLVEFPGATHSMFTIEPEQVIAVIEEFVTGTPTEIRGDRVLATIVVVDIVGSTEILSQLGDAGWRDLLERYYALTEHELRAFDGTEVDRAGDGLIALFDGPTRAIRCVLRIEERARSLGLHVRAGVHTGEVERVGKAVRGIAVHVAARIAGLAGSDEMLTSRTVRDLTVGSGLAFQERGAHALKGVTDPQHVFAVCEA